MAGFRSSVLIDGVASDASSVGAPISCNEESNVRVQVSGVTTGTPVGTFVFYGCESTHAAEVDKAHGVFKPGSGTAQWTPLNIPEQAVHGTGFTAFSDVTAAIAWDGSTTLNMDVNLDSPPAYLAIAWVRTSGGSASTNKITAIGNARGRGN
jgi:hypothetical protein